MHAVTPGTRYVWGGPYEPRGPIWHSRRVTEDHAVIECRAALALPARQDRTVALRRVVATCGTARVDVSPQACGEFGRGLDACDVPEP